MEQAHPPPTVRCWMTTRILLFSHRPLPFSHRYTKYYFDPHRLHSKNTYYTTFILIQTTPILCQSQSNKLTRPSPSPLAGPKWHKDYSPSHTDTPNTRRITFTHKVYLAVRQLVLWLWEQSSVTTHYTSNTEYSPFTQTHRILPFHTDTPNTTFILTQTTHVLHQSQSLNQLTRPTPTALGRCRMTQRLWLWLHSFSHRLCTPILTQTHLILLSFLHRLIPFFVNL